MSELLQCRTIHNCRRFSLLEIEVTFQPAVKQSNDLFKTVVVSVHAQCVPVIGYHLAKCIASVPKTVILLKAPELYHQDKIPQFSTINRDVHIFCRSHTILQLSSNEHLDVGGSSHTSLSSYACCCKENTVYCNAQTNNSTVSKKQPPHSF